MSLTNETGDQFKVESLVAENTELKAILLNNLNKLIEDEKIGRVFHDFNNILSSSMGYSNLALERAKASSDEKLARYLENIERAGIRSRDLVRESITSRQDARDRVKTDLSTVVSSKGVENGAELPSGAKLYYTAEQLAAIYRLLFAGYDCDNAKMKAEVVEEFTCEACSQDLRGVQLKMKVEGVERLGKSDSALADGDQELLIALVNSQAGHLCESLLQDKQFVVYLRSVTPDNS